MKAHEETWWHDEVAGTVWDKASGDMVVQSAEREDRLVLASAAPDMARRLMGILRGFNQGYRLTPAEAQGIEVDLRKAGVL